MIVNFLDFLLLSGAHVWPSPWNPGLHTHIGWFVTFDVEHTELIEQLFGFTTTLDWADGQKKIWSQSWDTRDCPTFEIIKKVCVLNVHFKFFIFDCISLESTQNLGIYGQYVNYQKF